MKKIYSVPLVIMSILVVTNPSTKAFKDYVGAYQYGGIHRQLNFFVCSFYHYRGGDYLGVFGNFFNLSR